MNHRQASLAAGPVTLAALLLLMAGLATQGSESDLDIVLSPLFVASSVCAMIGLILIAFALVRFVSELEALQTGVGRLGSGIAFVGTMLAIGGSWSMVFVLPGLARMDGTAASAAENGIPLVVAGYIVSFVVLAIGWLIVGVALLRSHEVPRGVAIFFIVGALICIAPLPARFFVIALAITVLEARVLGRSTTVSASSMV